MNVLKRRRLFLEYCISAKYITTFVWRLGFRVIYFRHEKQKITVQFKRYINTNVKRLNISSAINMCGFNMTQSGRNGRLSYSQRSWNTLHIFKFQNKEFHFIKLSYLLIILKFCEMKVALSLRCYIYFSVHSKFIQDFNT